MDAKVIWSKKMSFTGLADSGFTIPIGTSQAFGGDDDGVRPMELIAIGLAGCTAMDVISILAKKRQEITGFEVKVHAERADDHPRVFTKMEVEYLVTGKNIDPSAVERAVNLSIEKYCSVQAMLKQSVPITHKITLVAA